MYQPDNNGEDYDLDDKQKQLIRDLFIHQQGSDDITGN